MCGIFGLIAKQDSQYNSNLLQKTTERLALLSESRGKDSSGFALRKEQDNSINIVKGPISVSELIREKLFQDEIKECLNKNALHSEERLKSTFAVIGHARLVTNGSQLEDVNNQPVVKDGVVGVHNGIIVNVDELWQKHSEIKRTFDIDTEVMLSLLRHHSKINVIEKAVAITNQEIFGTVATALFIDDRDEFVLFTNNGSLYVLTNYEDILIFASEKFILKSIIKDKKLSKEMGIFIITQVKPNSSLILNFTDFCFKEFDLDTNDRFANQEAKEKVPHSSGAEMGREKFKINIQNIDSKVVQKSVLVDISGIKVNPKAAFEQDLLEYNLEVISNLKRCTKCLLPETFTFIEFDKKGVCNYCNNYKLKNQPKSIEELQMLVEPYRRKNGELDCIIPYSGGRDSSFTLHLVKRVLGLNPIAYTYDWGMVTDLARRNIARVCGKLGVENIIVSANIRWKRNNIRKNLAAWLKKPRMGMVPLFMAGDKYFYYYTNKVKEQTGLKLNIYGMNNLENTDFKTGFCGIMPNFSKERIYSLKILDQIKLFLYVGRNFLINTSYMNSSLLDTLGSFFVRYASKKRDYYHLFDYYQWNEREIEQTLFDEYDWETAKDTETTWRIGDGTVGLYNYIYLTVAGFSEYDTFRSNQIREGMISREEGLKLIFKENKPRYESIKWYLEIIGLEFEDTIRIINNIPKIYTIK